MKVKLQGGPKNQKKFVTPAYADTKKRFIYHYGSYKVWKKQSGFLGPPCAVKMLQIHWKLWPHRGLKEAAKVKSSPILD